MKIGGIILAAGESRRMGHNKLLAEIGGHNMVRRTAMAALASTVLAPVIAVLGHQGEAVRAVLQDLPIEFIGNPDFAAGLSASLKLGIAALPPTVDGAVILLGDMPLTGAGTIRLLADAFDPENGRAICVPVHQGRRGNPVLLGRRFFPEITQLQGDTGARGLIARHQAFVVAVEIGDDSVLADIDTPEALEAIRRAEENNPGAK